VTRALCDRFQRTHLLFLRCRRRLEQCQLRTDERTDIERGASAIHADYLACVWASPDRYDLEERVAKYVAVVACWCCRVEQLCDLGDLVDKLALTPPERMAAS